jgi:regulator of replication initiation timing
LTELAKKVELLEAEVDDLMRSVQALQEENTFLQRLLEDPAQRSTLPPPQGS